jgi:ribosomal protein S18 acetylase RimI-like enzyme
MTLIREATEDDNDDLNELQKKCPMGTSFVLGVDSSPDYFARSRPFKDWHVLVAAENNTIIGSAAFAAKDTYVEDRQIKTAYEYGFIVDPLYRRRGIAKKLQRHIEQAALDSNVDLLHLDIIEDNIPSVSLFSKMGFEKAKDCTTFSLMPYKKQKTASEANVRSMDETDVDAVTSLINETYRNYNFFTPYRPNDFLEFLERTPHFDFHNILLLEENDGIKACLGYWEYNKVRKYIVQKLGWKLNLQMHLMRVIGLFTKMPHMPKLGEPFLSYNLVIMAYKNPESIAELIKKVVNIASENKINLIHVTVDPKNPTAAILSQFTHTKMKLGFFTKSLKQERLANLRERKLYVDTLEM